MLCHIKNKWNFTKSPLNLLNAAVLFQQQRYIVAILYLFYLSNGLNLSDFLLFQSIFYFTGLIAEIPAGYIGDIFPRKNILIFSYMLFMIRIILWIIIPNYYTILLGEILYGLSKAFYRGVCDSYIYDYLKINTQTNSMLNKYGKFNFFMSTGSAISCLLGAWLYSYIGATLLLFLELLCNSIAVLLLFFLPGLPRIKKRISVCMHFRRIFKTIKAALINSKYNIYMLYSGILTGITSIFVWSFQPFMKNFSLPVALFGIVYFINHMLRALGSIYAKKIINKFSLNLVGLVVWCLYAICFLIMSISLNYSGYFVCLSVLIFICIAIGIQIIFNVGNLSGIHNMIYSKSRATISSINSMLAGLFSGLFLTFYKIFVEKYSLMFALFIFFIIFLPTFFIIKNIFKKNIY